MIWQIVSALAAVLALVISMLLAGLSVARESRRRFMENFDKLYHKTFSFRQDISCITREQIDEGFFYEIDLINSCEDIRDRVLDYLTEMENFFFLVVGHRSVSRSFEKLMSLALYQRLSVFYGYILRQRTETNNSRLFLNYEKALKQIGKMKKIKSQFPAHQKRCYIGIRSSDRMYDGGYFSSDISIFSEDAGPQIFPIRPNQNKANKYVVPYMAGRIEQIVAQSPDCKFMFYNGTMAYNLPPHLHRHFMCLNSRELLQWLNSKPNVKRWLSECGLPVLPYETFLGQEITLDMLERRFRQADRYVVQSNYGGGGMGTFLVSADNFDKVQSLLQPLRQYLVSAYIKHGVSVNTHVFISDKQTILSPGSIQIVVPEQTQLCYRGADYIAFRTLPSACRERVRTLSLKIANRLRLLGYRGVAGLDFLITWEQKVYCIEINPRFQASSTLLDLYLQRHKAGIDIPDSLFALNEQAFANRMISTLCFHDAVDYSCYFYYKGEAPLKYLMAKRGRFSEEKVLIHDDGFLCFAEETLLDKDSYLFRAIFPHAICSVSPDMTLMLNDNIPVRQAPAELLDLKIALLNQGAVVKNASSDVKKGAYESIDIVYRGPLCDGRPVPMNCAIQINLSQYSPFTVHVDGQKSNLGYYGIPLGPVSVEMDQLDGLPPTDRRILYLSADRLRIKLIAGCEYKNIGWGCRFCNLPLSDKRFTKKELTGALLRLKEKAVPFRHILIGGGTCLEKDIWDEIEWLCRFLSGDEFYKGKPLSLMSVPPPKEMLPVLRDAGLAEVAFNLELSDDNLAQELMPGKQGQPKTAYYSVLEEAVRVFGVGAVRSALLVGLEREDILLEEVRHLAKMGVIPCLSAFRALPGSEFVGAIHPDNATLHKIYTACVETLAAMDGPIKTLGPACRHCRNNMLAI